MLFIFIYFKLIYAFSMILTAGFTGELVMSVIVILQRCIFGISSHALRSQFGKFCMAHCNTFLFAKPNQFKMNPNIDTNMAPIFDVCGRNAIARLASTKIACKYRLLVLQTSVDKFKGNNRNDSLEFICH
jgi:hypothetical protein